MDWVRLKMTQTCQRLIYVVLSDSSSMSLETLKSLLSDMGEISLGIKNLNHNVSQASKSIAELTSVHEVLRMGKPLISYTLLMTNMNISTSVFCA